MKTIQTVHIKNFQKHRDLTLEFKPGVNTITGPSDAGKSSILRAIMWCLRNEPEGLAFITNGEKLCKVSITFDDETVVTRERGKTVNRYKLEGKDNLTLDSFGKGVPDAIQAAIGFGPVKIGGDYYELNFSKQLEPPFLLTSTPSKRMAIINQLSGVGVLSEIIGGLNKDITNAGKSISAAGEMRDNYESDEKFTIEKSEKLESFISSAKIVQSELSQLNEKHKVTIALIESNERIESLTNLSARVSNCLSRIDVSITEIKSLADKLKSLQGLQSAIDKTNKELDRCAHVNDVRVGAEIDIAYINTDITNLSALNELNIAWQRNVSFFERCEKAEQLRPAVAISFSEIEHMIDKLNILNSICTEIKDNFSNLDRYSYESKHWDKELARDTNDVKEFIVSQKACPVCEKPFNDNDIERMAM